MQEIVENLFPLITYRPKKRYCNFLINLLEKNFNSHPDTYILRFAIYQVCYEADSWCVLKQYNYRDKRETTLELGQECMSHSGPGIYCAMPLHLHPFHVP